MVTWIRQVIQRQPKLLGQVQWSFRFVVLSVAVIMACVLTLSMIFNYWMLKDALKDSTTKRYKAEVRHIVETMTATIESSVPSRFTAIGPDMDKEVLDRVKDMIRNAKFDYPNGYFFMFDAEGFVIAQGIQQDREGTYRRYAKDDNGIHYVLLLIDAAKREAAKREGNFVEYMMEKPEQEGKGRFPKIAYAKMLRGNQWWVGSGVYVDAIEEDIRAQDKMVLLQIVFVAILSGGFLVGLLFLAFRLGSMLAEQITGPITQFVAGAKRISAGAYDHRVEIDGADEFKDFAGEFNSMGGHLGGTILDLRAFTDRERTLIEEERGRIARELHDEIGEKLLTLRRGFEHAQIPAEDESQEALRAHTIQSIIEIADGVRAILQDLRPRPLDELGLSAALRVHLEKQAQSANIVIRFPEQDTELRLPPEVETHVFRVVQEAMANVVRHASACRVDVWIRCHGEMLEVCMQDDGRGFDVDAKMRGEGGRPSFGLLNIKERVRSLGGTVRWVSDPRSGTKVSVHIPINKRSTSVNLSD